MLKSFLIERIGLYVETPVYVDRPTFSFRAGVDVIIDGVSKCGNGLKIDRQFTGLEKALMGCVFGYAAYKVCSSKIPKNVYGWLTTRKIGSSECEVQTECGTSTHRRLESRRQNSEEEPMTAPKHQAKVGVFRDGKFIVIGCAQRFKDGVIVAPDHVIAEESEPKYLMGSIPGKVVSLQGRELIPLATDLVMLRMDSAELSTLGLREAKIGFVSGKTYCQIVGPVGKGTQGDLDRDEVFGRVNYAATTLPGYSGAGYTTGAALMGIHQSGGRVNGGYAASYVWSLVKETLGHLESSEDWLKSNYDAGKALRWEKNPTDPSYVRVEVNGEYSNVTRAALTSAFGADWDSDMIIRPKVSRAKAAKYNDFEFESSGEWLMNSPRPGGSSSQVVNQGPQAQNHPNTILPLSLPSQRQRKAVVNWLTYTLEQLERLNLDTAGLAKADQQGN